MNSSPPPHPPGSASHVLTTALVVAASLLVVLLLYICVAIAVRRIRGKREGGRASQSSHAVAFLCRHGLHHSRPTFEETSNERGFRAATAEFDAARKLGDDGFGTVYLAYLPPAGRSANVKRLHVPPSPSPSSATITKSFCNEVLILSALRHPHLVCLHGFCTDQRALRYAGGRIGLGQAALACP
ncbi:hypothetical protein ZWY2020_031777 [Hordeum vulgare]|nr:hypothetical protein ZWY2020_031777 [Hordeum vulgare]